MLGDCPTIHVGGAHELFRTVIQQIRLGGLSNKFYRNSVVSFREQKSFVLKIVILLAFGLGMCEGVGEDTRHGIGHVDIQVGSCICLSVIVCHDMCALRWGVTHVGNYHYWALLTLSRDHYFRYRECTGGRRSLEVVF